MKTVQERKRKKSMKRQSQRRHRRPVNEPHVSTTDCDAPAPKRSRVTIEEVTDEGDNPSHSVPSTRTKYVSSSPPFLVLSHLDQG